MNDYPHWVTPSTNILCKAPGCQMKGSDLPRPTIPGSDLCSWHRTHFIRTLTDLAGLWPDLERALYKRSGHGGARNTRVHTSTITDIAQIWNPHVTQTMTDLTDWTSFLVRVVLAERPLPPTPHEAHGRALIERTHGVRLDMTTPEKLLALAGHHAHWLAAYPDLGVALLTDADGHRMAAMRAISADPVRRVGINNATCGHVLDRDGDLILTCTKPMVAILNDDNTPGLLVCSGHPFTHRRYTPSEWLEWTT